MVIVFLGLYSSWKMLEHYNISYNKEATKTPEPSDDQNRLKCFHFICLVCLKDFIC